METLLDYLIRNKDEREAKLAEYEMALPEYERAKRNLESFGDVTLLKVEIEKLTAYVQEVSEQQGAVAYGETDEA